MFTYSMASWALLFLPLPLVLAGTEILKNPDFETTHFGNSDWWGLSATLTSSNDAFHGHKSVKVSKRTHSYGAIEQLVSVTGNTRYYFRAHVKLLNLPTHGKNVESVNAGIMVKDKHTGKQDYLGFGSTPHLQAGQWHIVGGDLKLPAGQFSEARVYIRPNDQSVDFLVDYASLQQVPALSAFPSDANKRIDAYRKADLTIRLDGHSVDPSGLSVEVKETSGLFAFGSAVNAKALVDPTMKGYQNWFYSNFDWAVIENDLKWTNMEPKRGHIDYDTAMNAWNDLHKHGIKVRGHNIFWESHSPSWVSGLSGQELKKVLEKRLHDVLGHFKGKLEHWDVDNECLHSDLLVKQAGDLNLTMWMFHEAHRIDPHPTLFLNDYGVINYASSTVALEDLAMYYKAAGVPIGAVGVQSHLHYPIDLAAIKARLDEVAKAGLPVWITELTVEGVKEHDKPQVFEDLLTLYFSHPAVHGVLIWGFWDKRMSRPESALCNGPSCIPNDSGKRVSHLLQTKWRTHETHNIRQGQTIKVRGFKGNYKLDVKHHGQVIHEENFYLGYKGADLHVSLSGSSKLSEVPI